MFMAFQRHTKGAMLYYNMHLNGSSSLIDTHNYLRFLGCVQLRSFILSGLSYHLLNKYYVEFQLLSILK